MLDDEILEENMVVMKYVCNNCNSSFCTTNSNRIDHCVVCGSMNIVNNEAVEEKKLLFIPFLKDLKDAQTDYKKKVFPSTSKKYSKAEER